MRLPLLLALLLAAPVGCSADRPGAPEGGDIPTGAIAIARDSGENPLHDWRVWSAIDERDRLVIRDRETWERFWLRATANQHPPPPVAQVDFQRSMVVVATMGLRHTGGYNIEIEALHRFGNDLYVTVRETSPGPACGTYQALTRPLAAARVDKVSGQVIFIERETAHHCR